ncbi:dihydropteroate synthase [bacterium]|nr:dihydropteroate synthase [bacterium]
MHNPRVVIIDDLSRAKEELKRIGVDSYGIRLMAPKALFFAVKLEKIRPQTANILKQEALSLGAEAAASRRVIDLKRKRSDVLLLGTEKQYRLLVEKLKRQPFSLAEIAEEIKNLLANFKRKQWKIESGKYTLKIGRRTLIMGILNVTPDSFADGGRYDTLDSALLQAEGMAEEGADIIDVGGESTRPGTRPVPLQEELRRTIPVIKRLVKRINLPISIDTYKSRVAREALDSGASLVNDISALRLDEGMSQVVSKYKAPLILMHMQGRPRNMQKNPKYGDVVGEIISFLRERIAFAKEEGIDGEKIIIDPGIGFGKKKEHNLEIFNRLSEFKSLGRPILVGPSRKSVIGDVLGLPVEERLEGTAATAAASILNGADMVRVHDVKEMKRVADMIDAILREQ